MDVVIATAAFVAGQQVFAAAGVRLRRPAGLKGDIIHQLSERTPVTVLGAAQAKDGLSWWPVRVALDGGQTEEGWMAQTAAEWGGAVERGVGAFDAGRSCRRLTSQSSQSRKSGARPRIRWRNCWPL